MSKELYANSALHRFVRYRARDEIMKAVGDISGIELFGTQLLVAPYVRSGILLSPTLGIPESEVLSCDALAELYESGRGFMAQKFAVEDLFQGKVCLVLALGTGLLETEARRKEIAERLDGGLPPDEYADLQDEAASLKPLEFGVGDWVFTLQENTRGVSISAPGAQQSRVLKALGIDYVGWPSKFLYASDVYGRLNDPNILA